MIGVASPGNETCLRENSVQKMLSLVDHDRVGVGDPLTQECRCLRRSVAVRYCGAVEDGGKLNTDRDGARCMDQADLTVIWCTSPCWISVAIEQRLEWPSGKRKDATIRTTSADGHSFPIGEERTFQKSGSPSRKR